LQQQLQTAKEENEKLNKLHAFLHNKFNWSKEDVWIRNYLSSYIFNEEMVGDGKEYISPMKQISDLTQQNKKMKGLISEINSEYSDDGILSKSTKYAIQQALNQPNTKEKLKQLTELSQEYGLYDDVKGVE
jgi:hypothetical protein